MRRVFSFMGLVLVLIGGCDTSPPKPKTSSLQQSAVVAETVLQRQSAGSQREVQLLQRRAYLSLADGELLAVCRSLEKKQVFEEAVCRQQRQAGIEWLADEQGALPKPSAVLGKREDKRNPWHWLVARETCWSADCLHAERLRSFAKRCGALQGSCVHGEIVW